MNSVNDRPGTLEKALKINLAHTIYGTFAEIGAGQEIANWFFRAGGASGTVAKTMSAYDMTISDEIYGKCSRYVSRQRMCDMLEHEYPMLIQRLNAKRGATTTFFTLADTVRVYAAFHLRDDLSTFLESLLDDLSRKRVEIDMIDFTGPAFAASEFQDRLVALKLVRLGLADAALFGADGEIWQASDVLYKKPVFLKRGSFDPITKLNLDMIERGQAAFQADFGEAARDNIEILEITMHNLLASGAEVPDTEFLARADVLQALGKNVLISTYPEFHRVSSYLARHTQCPIGIVLGLPLFQELFNERWCTDLEGGLLESFGRLFKNQVRVYVYPMGNPMNGQILGVNDVRVTPEQKHLLRYLIETQSVRALEEPNQDFLFHTSAEVRNMINARDLNWQSLVPDIVLKQGPWREIGQPVM
ncbi:MAG: TonB-dependent receptor [Verrucomicrobia bacterium]|nr:TonB-dependent receptor [Verrucomicrobiota bacterium]